MVEIHDLRPRLNQKFWPNFITLILILLFILSSICGLIGVYNGLLYFSSH